MGKTALVTGAASGIGRAAARLFALRGYDQVLCDHDEKGLRETEEEIVGLRLEHGESIGNATAVRVDVREEEEIREAVRIAMATYGRLDAAVNNAGISGERHPLHELPKSEFERVLSVNLTGVFLGMKHQIPEMLAAGHGSVVNVSSILGVVGYANAAAYTASKHAMIGLTRAAAVEYSSRGVRVNAVCPAFIRTPMLVRAGVLDDPEQLDFVESLHPIGRLGESDEVAHAILWLAQEDSAFVTGHAMMVDGGYTAR